MKLLPALIFQENSKCCFSSEFTFCICKDIHKVTGLCLNLMLQIVLTKSQTSYNCHAKASLLLPGVAICQENTWKPQKHLVQCWEGKSFTARGKFWFRWGCISQTRYTDFRCQKLSFGLWGFYDPSCSQMCPGKLSGFWWGPNSFVYRYLLHEQSPGLEMIQLKGIFSR